MAEEKLTLIESIRKRPGMYIGCVSTRGLKAMFKDFFDDILQTNKNNIDIDIDFKTNNLIILCIENIDTDFFIETIEKLNGKDEVISFGLPVIIALSEKLNLKIVSNSSLLSLSSSKGIYKFNKKIVFQKKNGIEIKFQIDQTIFEITEINYEAVNHFLRKYAFINTTCRIVSHDSRTRIRQTNLFEYPKGLSQQLDIKISELTGGDSLFRLDLSTTIDNYDYQICISFQDDWSSQTIIQTYANCDELINGGSLEQGVLDGLLSAVKQLASKRRIAIDERRIKNQLIVLAVIKGSNFNFCGAERIEINMPQVQKKVKKFVSKKALLYLSENKNIIKQLLRKVRKYE